eukprot:TRINITY_DN55899_c0_g1_i1.p1 TRINITY_DN55899_c0_g1~~TRINITY_DN55899_c0_g1_i1.p1  ORF type:complete len:380 (+),score=63.53 TRINITY_DN55899_c0_g1_i1:54-1193(+)
MAFSVGTAVRVRWQEASRRATVACAEEDGKVEVLFNDDESEAVVDVTHVSALEAFEHEPLLCRKCSLDELRGEVARCKEEGNTLFRLGDAAAAAERYSAAVGALGAVAEGSGRALAALNRTLWAGRVTGAESAGASFRFEFLQPVNGSTVLARPATRAVQRSRLLRVQENDLGELQVTHYLNRARCWLSLGSPARAVQDCELAVAVRRCTICDFETGSPLANTVALAALVAVALGGSCIWARQFSAMVVLILCVLIGARVLGISSLRDLCSGWLSRSASTTSPRDARMCAALFLRARARLAQGKLKAAEADLKLAEAAAPVEGASTRADLAKLRREIVEARRRNKRLAKEVAKWCEAAMAKASPDAFAAVADASEPPVG